MSESTLREHGLRIGHLEPGAANAITDVAGVRVGHVTVVRDEPEPPAGRGVARTGVTAILPGRATRLPPPVPAGRGRLNGAGELTGSLQISEWGLIETPIFLTSTMAVGRVFDGAVAAACEADPAIGIDEVVIPVVGECDDSWLNDARTVQVEAEDAGRAVRGRGGRGRRPGLRRRRYGHDRVRLEGRDRLVQPRSSPRSRRPSACSCSRTSARRRTCGSTACRCSRRSATASTRVRRPAAASPSSQPTRRSEPAQLERLARRAGLGLARTGSVAHHGSGEIFLAFSTAASERDEAPPTAVDRSPFPTRTWTRSSPRSSRRPRRPC